MNSISQLQRLKLTSNGRIYEENNKELQTVRHANFNDSLMLRN